MKKLILISAATIAGGAIVWLIATSRIATLNAKYRVVRADGRFEIRDYPEMQLASTAMRSGGMNSEFGELFRFITGANQRREKIAMTAPVLIDRTPEKETMSFIMPEELETKGAPAPNGENVRIEKTPKTRFAAFRFYGERSRINEKNAVEKLREWARATGVELSGDPMFAYYDPPWTPTFLRRNEVLVRVTSGAN